MNVLSALYTASDKVKVQTSIYLIIFGVHVKELSNLEVNISY